MEEIINNKVGYLNLPEGFVYLDEWDATIQISLRYNSIENFTGSIIDGYKASRVILTRHAAHALCKVQKDLIKDGFSLVVYDAYRPQKAVNHFIRWATLPSDAATKANYYPNINKQDAFKLGYIGEKSSHTRGSTVDVSIISSAALQEGGEEYHGFTTSRFGNTTGIGSSTFAKVSPLLPLQIRTINGYELPFLDDGTVDMGSSFDLFDKASHHGSSSHMTADYLARRDYLRSNMEKHGFVAYEEEWWHYTLANEPFPSTYFDFDIE